MLPGNLRLFIEIILVQISVYQHMPSTFQCVPSATHVLLDMRKPLTLTITPIALATIDLELRSGAGLTELTC